MSSRYRRGSRGTEHYHSVNTNAQFVDLTSPSSSVLPAPSGYAPVPVSSVQPAVGTITGVPPTISATRLLLILAVVIVVAGAGLVGYMYFASVWLFAASSSSSSIISSTGRIGGLGGNQGSLFSSSPSPSPSSSPYPLPSSSLSPPSSFSSSSSPVSVNVLASNNVALFTGSLVWNVNSVGTFMVGDVIQMTWTQDSGDYMIGTITAIGTNTITVNSQSHNGQTGIPWTPWSFTLISASSAAAAASSSIPMLSSSITHSSSSSGSSGSVNMSSPSATCNSLATTRVVGYSAINNTNTYYTAPIINNYALSSTFTQTQAESACQSLCCENGACQVIQISVGVISTSSYNVNCVSGSYCCYLMSTPFNTTANSGTNLLYMDYQSNSPTTLVNGVHYNSATSTLVTIPNVANAAIPSGSQSSMASLAAYCNAQCIGIPGCNYYITVTSNTYCQFGNSIQSWNQPVLTPSVSLTGRVGKAIPNMTPLSWTYPTASEYPLSSSRLRLAPPRGFNSWDSYTNYINETQVLAVAKGMYEMGYVAAGFNMLVLDADWYIDNQSPNTGDISVDSLCRMIPDPNKFPSAIVSGANVGFAPLAATLKSTYGVLLGLHSWAGVPSAGGCTYPSSGAANGIYFGGGGVVPQDYEENNEGTSNTNWFIPYYWGIEYFSIQAYINAQIDLYASWGIEYVKIDNVFYPKEADILPSASQLVASYRQGIAQSSNPRILLSISAGYEFDLRDNAAAASMADIYRVTPDLNPWPIATYPTPANFIGMYSVTSGLSSNIWQRILVSFSFQGLTTAIGGNSFSDFDMLPIGYMQGQLNEIGYPASRSIMTIYGIGRSSLIMGGSLDQQYYDPTINSIVLNPDLLYANAYGYNVSLYQLDGTYSAYIQSFIPSIGYQYQGMVNILATASGITFQTPLLQWCTIRDIWAGQTLSSPTWYYSLSVAPDDAQAIVISNCAAFTPTYSYSTTSINLPVGPNAPVLNLPFLTDIYDYSTNHYLTGFIGTSATIISKSVSDQNSPTSGVLVSSSFMYPTTSSITISFWWQPLSTSVNYLSILQIGSQAVVSNYFHSLSIGYTQGVFQFYFQPTTYLATWTVSIPITYFSHIALTLNPTGGNNAGLMYLNGTVVSGCTGCTSSATVTTTPIYLAPTVLLASNTGQSQGTGALRAFQVYTSILSPSQITNLYSAQLAYLNPPTLVSSSSTPFVPSPTSGQSSSFSSSSTPVQQASLSSSSSPSPAASAVVSSSPPISPTLSWLVTSSNYTFGDSTNPSNAAAAVYIVAASNQTLCLSYGVSGDGTYGNGDPVQFLPCVLGPTAGTVVTNYQMYTYENNFDLECAAFYVNGYYLYGVGGQSLGFGEGYVNAYSYDTSTQQFIQSGGGACWQLNGVGIGSGIIITTCNSNLASQQFLFGIIQ